MAAQPESHTDADGRQVRLMNKYFLNLQTCKPASARPTTHGTAYETLRALLPAPIQLHLLRPIASVPLLRPLRTTPCMNAGQITSYEETGCIGIEALQTKGDEVVTGGGRSQGARDSAKRDKKAGERKGIECTGAVTEDSASTAELAQEVSSLASVSGRTKHDGVLAEGVHLVYTGLTGGSAIEEERHDVSSVSEGGTDEEGRGAFPLPIVQFSMSRLAVPFSSCSIDCLSYSSGTDCITEQSTGAPIMWKGGLPLTMERGKTWVSSTSEETRENATEAAPETSVSLDSRRDAERVRSGTACGEEELLPSLNGVVALQTMGAARSNAGNALRGEDELTGQGAGGSLRSETENAEGRRHKQGVTEGSAEEMGREAHVPSAAGGVRERERRAGVYWRSELAGLPCSVGLSASQGAEALTPWAKHSPSASPSITDPPECRWFVELVFCTSSGFLPPTASGSLHGRQAGAMYMRERTLLVTVPSNLQLPARFGSRAPGGASCLSSISGFPAGASTRVTGTTDAEGARATSCLFGPSSADRSIRTSNTPRRSAENAAPGVRPADEHLPLSSDIRGLGLRGKHTETDAQRQETASPACTRDEMQGEGTGSNETSTAGQRASETEGRRCASNASEGSRGAEEEERAQEETGRVREQREEDEEKRAGKAGKGGTKTDGEAGRALQVAPPSALPVPDFPSLSPSPLVGLLPSRRSDAFDASRRAEELTSEGVEPVPNSSDTTDRIETTVEETVSVNIRYTEEREIETEGRLCASSVSEGREETLRDEERGGGRDVQTARGQRERLGATSYAEPGGNAKGSSRGEERGDGAGKSTTGDNNGRALKLALSGAPPVPGFSTFSPSPWSEFFLYSVLDPHSCVWEPTGLGTISSSSTTFARARGAPIERFLTCSLPAYSSLPRWLRGFDLGIWRTLLAGGSTSTTTEGGRAAPFERQPMRPPSALSRNGPYTSLGLRLPGELGARSSGWASAWRQSSGRKKADLRPVDSRANIGLLILSDLAPLPCSSNGRDYTFGRSSETRTRTTSASISRQGYERSAGGSVRLELDTKKTAVDRQRLETRPTLTAAARESQGTDEDPKLSSVSTHAKGKCQRYADQSESRCGTASTVLATGGRVPLRVGLTLYSTLCAFWDLRWMCLVQETRREQVAAASQRDRRGGHDTPSGEEMEGRVYGGLGLAEENTTVPEGGENVGLSEVDSEDEGAMGSGGRECVSVEGEGRACVAGVSEGEQRITLGERGLVEGEGEVSQDMEEQTSESDDRCEGEELGRGTRGASVRAANDDRTTTPGGSLEPETACSPSPDARSAPRSGRTRSREGVIRVPGVRDSRVIPAPRPSLDGDDWSVTVKRSLGIGAKGAAGDTAAAGEEGMVNGDCRRKGLETRSEDLEDGVLDANARSEYTAEAASSCSPGYGSDLHALEATQTTEEFDAHPYQRCERQQTRGAWKRVSHGQEGGQGLATGAEEREGQTGEGRSGEGENRRVDEDLRRNTRTAGRDEAGEQGTARNGAETAHDPGPDNRSAPEAEQTRSSREVGRQPGAREEQDVYRRRRGGDRGEKEESAGWSLGTCAIKGPVGDSEPLAEGLATADTGTESSMSSEGVLLMFFELGGDSDEEHKKYLRGSGLSKGEPEEDLQAPLGSSYETSGSDAKAAGVGVRADNNAASRTVSGLDGDDDETACKVLSSAEEECRAQCARHEAEERAVRLKVIEELAEREWGKDWKSRRPPPFDWAQRAEPTEPETPSLELLELFEEESVPLDVHDGGQADDEADGESADEPGEDLLETHPMEEDDTPARESEVHQAEPPTSSAEEDTVYGLYVQEASPSFVEDPSPKKHTRVEDLSGSSWTLEDWHYARPVAADSMGDRTTVPDATTSVAESTCPEWGEDVLQALEARHEEMVKFEKQCNDNLRILADHIEFLHLRMEGLTGDSQYLSVKGV